MHITLENGPELAQGDGLQGFIECDANLFLSSFQQLILVLPGFSLRLEALPGLLSPPAADFVGQNQTNRAVLFTVAEMVIHRSYLLLWIGEGLLWYNITVSPCERVVCVSPAGICGTSGDFFNIVFIFLQNFAGFYNTLEIDSLYLLESQ